MGEVRVGERVCGYVSGLANTDLWCNTSNQVKDGVKYEVTEDLTKPGSAKRNKNRDRIQGEASCN